MPCRKRNPFEGSAVPGFAFKGRDMLQRGFFQKRIQAARADPVALQRLRFQHGAPHPQFGAFAALTGRAAIVQRRVGFRVARQRGRVAEGGQQVIFQPRPVGTLSQIW